jgi:cell division protein FtsB
MAQDFEQLLKDQLGKVTTRLQDMAREAVKDELSKLHAEVGELRARVAVLEAERAQKAADSLETF